MPGPKSTFLPSFPFVRSFAALLLFGRGEIGKSFFLEGTAKSSKFNVQFEDDVVIHKMGNEPKRTDRRAFNNIMFGNDRGHITPKVAVDNFPFLPSLSIPMNIRRVTNGCDHTFLIKSHNWDDSVLFACSLRNTGWIDGSGGEGGKELTGRRRRRSSPSYFLALCLPLLPAFYFLPLSGNKTKQPLGGKKVLLTSVVVYVVFVADGFSPLGSVFLPISLSFSRSLTRARRTDGQF